MENPSEPPTLIPGAGLTLPDNSQSLRVGTWIITLEPTTQIEGNPLIFDGALRIAQRQNGLSASADIYQRESGPSGESPLTQEPPSPSAGVPILKRSQYRVYWLVTSFTVDETNLFAMTYQVWEWLTNKNDWAPNPQTARLEFQLRGADRAEGTTFNDNNDVDNKITMTWVSGNFRRLTLEIETVTGLELPLDDGTGHDWSTALDGIADFNLIQGNTKLAEGSQAGWTLAEMHATMLQKSGFNDLDHEWRYYVLVVKLIADTERGIMFDYDATDSNNTPREGICIATDWVPPTTGELNWGLAAGKRWGSEKAPFFRTAVHEIGHAFGLVHNDSGYMNTSDTYADEGTIDKPFPTNIDWFWKADDIKRLQHWPDVYVRPGGVPFGAANDTILHNSLVTTDSLQSSSVSTSNLELVATPVLSEVPLGAPVRVDIELKNNGATAIRVPSKISLMSGFTSGTVENPSKISRTFRPLLYCTEEQPMADLPKRGSIKASLTLLRGGDGSLFPNSGLHTVNVKIQWGSKSRGSLAIVQASCTVFVTAPISASHAAAAHRILVTPDAHLVLALGGDHLKDGINAIQTCLHDPTLAPHFAAVEAKRVACQFQQRKANIKGAQKLLGSKFGRAIMSDSERFKLTKIGLQCAKCDLKRETFGQKVLRFFHLSL